MIELRTYQVGLVAEARATLAGGRRRVLLQAPTGSGKCLARGTPVLMFDGTVLPVEEIEVGDLLMGPDSRPREVMSLARGTELMFCIVPKRGDPFTVNASHILSLKMAKGNKLGYDDHEMVNISVLDYLEKNKTFQHCSYLWRTGVDFPPAGNAERSLLLEPYFLGLWLGDGSSRHPMVTSGDPEVVDYLHGLAVRVNLPLRVEPNSLNSNNYHLVDDNKTRSRGRGIKTNPLRNALASYRLLRNKHIPKAFKVGSRQTRLELLAGIIDTDGHHVMGNYEVTQKNRVLAEDIVFVARSLGFHASLKETTKTCGNNGVTGTYWRIMISGHTDEIPCRIARKIAAVRGINKDTSVTGFSVEPVGEDEYFGFEISGPDRLFLLGDFTVTHNTVMFAHVADRVARKGKRALILVHRQELVRQTVAKLAEYGAVPDLITAGTREVAAGHVAVASVQTLVRRLHHYPDDPWDLVVVDEAHHAVAGTWAKVLGHFPRAYVLGVTATPERLDGRGLAACFDALVAGPPVRQLIDGGWLADFTCYSHPTSPDLSQIKTVAGDYDRGGLSDVMSRASLLGDVEQHYRTHLDGKPAIAFGVTIRHAELLAQAFRDKGWRAVSVDGTLDDDERARRIGGLADGSVQVLTSCELVSEGLDVPAVSGALLCRPTQSLAVYLQQVGRVMRPKAHKAVILDHAGNALRHGLPDQPHAWSLTSDRRKAAERSTVKVCRACFATVPVACKICPECGTPFPLAQAKPPPRAKSGELVEIREWQHVERSKAGVAAAVAQCRTFAELKALAKHMGYARGWAFHAARDRGWRPIVNGMGYTVNFVPPRPGYGSG